MIELKTFKEIRLPDDADGRRRYSLDSFIHAIQMRENLGAWLDIAPRWEGNKVIGAPYELTREGDKLTIVDKVHEKSGSIELLSIKPDYLVPDVILGNASISFRHCLPSFSPFEARFKVDGDLDFRTRASDSEGVLFLESFVENGVLIERFDEVRDKLTGEKRAQEGVLSVDPTLDLQTAASTDDGYEDTGSGGVDTGGYYIKLGTTNYDGFFRWQAAIPQLSTITVCYISIYVYGTTYNDLYVDMHFEKVATPAALTGGAATFDISNRTKTTAFVSWAEDNLVGAAWNNSASLVVPLQEVIDNFTTTYVAGIWHSQEINDCRIYAWDQTGNVWGPKIHIEYTSAGGGTSGESAAMAAKMIGHKMV